jgi:hypothetical protein
MIFKSNYTYSAVEVIMVGKIAILKYLQIQRIKNMGLIIKIKDMQEIIHHKNKMLLVAVVGNIIIKVRTRRRIVIQTIHVLQMFLVL